jgi:hypothetical protein
LPRPVSSQSDLTKPWFCALVCASCWATLPTAARPNLRGEAYQFEPCCCDTTTDTTMTITITTTAICTYRTHHRFDDTRRRR